MSVGTFADGVLAGLGLFLLGAWLLQEGMARSAGALVQRALTRHVRERHHAWSLGALLGLLLPVSETSSRTVAGLANTGLVRPHLMLWIAAGHAAGLAGLAWIFALLARNDAGSALALALIAGGVAAMWTAPERSRGAIGRAMAGCGLLLAGMVLLAEGFEHGRGVLALDSFAGGMALRTLVLGIVGAALAVFLRSGAAAVVIAAAAASGGTLTTPSAVAMAIGAGLGAVASPLLALESLTPATRRAAIGLLVTHSLTLASGWVLLFCSLPLLANPIGPLNDPAQAIALLATLALAGPALVLRSLDSQVQDQIKHRFVADENEPTAPQHVDGSLALAPELGLTALLGEARRQQAIARQLAAAVVSRERLTERREQDDRDALRALADVVEAAAADLARRPLPEEVASALPGVLRATQSAWELGEQSVYLNAAELAGEGPLGQTLEARMTRLQLDVARLLAAADPEADEPTCIGLEGALASIESRLAEMRTWAVARCAEGALDPAGLERSVERLSTLRRIAQLGVDSTLDLARALPGAASAAADAEDDLEAALVVV